MQLDERKTKILQAIIRNYLETGEPVGSRTISKYTDLNLSSATIRNEMADLEELGYIVQPHTSAGRIPSDKGYRFYVDAMMEEKGREVADMKEMLLEKEDKMEALLKQVVRVLAQSTNYATMISAPQIHRNKLKFIQLSRGADSPAQWSAPGRSGTDPGGDRGGRQYDQESYAGCAGRTG